jgi:hypothetical protein
VIDKKIDMLDAHVSQVYEWLPWHAGRLDQVPADPAARKAWLKQQRSRSTVSPALRASLVKWYGEQAAAAVRQAEAFEICEYGTRPDEAMIRRLFPFSK